MYIWYRGLLPTDVYLEPIVDVIHLIYHTNGIKTEHLVNGKLMLSLA